MIVKYKANLSCNLQEGLRPLHHVLCDLDGVGSRENLQWGWRSCGWFRSVMTSHQLEQLLGVEWNDEGRTWAESVVAYFSVLLIRSPEPTTCLEVVLKVKDVCVVPCTVSVMCQELQWRLARLPSSCRDGVTCFLIIVLWCASGHLNLQNWFWMCFSNFARHSNKEAWVQLLPWRT